MTYYVEHYEKRDYIYPISRNKILFKLKTNISNISSIEYIYFEKIRKTPKKAIQMHGFNLTGDCSFYQGILEYSETIKYIDYYFKITSDEGVFYFSPEGLRGIEPRRSFMYSDTNYYDVFITPKWAEGRIGYQIFPDRFHIGKKNLLENPTDWKEKPTRENFFGGNISGIIQKIGYLQDMNIGIVYLTPIFKSYSNHKYDTVDYFDIDPGFGTKSDFKKLVHDLHEAGIKIVIDGVFNHIGYYSEQFQDVIAKGKDSIYYDWFYVYGDTVDTENINYECVGYYKWMPKLRYQTKAVRDYIKNAGEYWLVNFNIDGYRLDVSDEVDFTFWQEFRRHIKSINEHALLIGETWKNGSDLLRGDTLDSIMNYRLRDALLDFIIYEYIDLHEFQERVNAIYFDYPIQTHNILYNTLGSHDTERIMTLCEEQTDKLSLLISLLFAYPGIPFIYYGDELGMTGLNDPLSRKTMNWSKVYNDIHLFFLKEMEQRTSSDVLKYGDFVHLNISDKIYGFVRRYKEEEIIFIANTTNEIQKFEVNYGTWKQEFTLLPYKSEIIKINK